MTVPQIFADIALRLRILQEKPDRKEAQVLHDWVRDGGFDTLKTQLDYFLQQMSGPSRREMQKGVRAIPVFDTADGAGFSIILPGKQDSSVSVTQVKRLIQEKTGYPPTDQHVFMGETELTNEPNVYSLWLQSGQHPLAVYAGDISPADVADPLPTAVAGGLAVHEAEDVVNQNLHQEAILEGGERERELRSHPTLSNISSASSPQEEIDFLDRVKRAQASGWRPRFSRDPRTSAPVMVLEPPRTSHCAYAAPGQLYMVGSTVYSVPPVFWQDTCL